MIFMGMAMLTFCLGIFVRFIQIQILHKYDVLSTHADVLSGHFCLLQKQG